MSSEPKMDAGKPSSHGRFSTSHGQFSSSQGVDSPAVEGFRLAHAGTSGQLPTSTFLLLKDGREIGFLQIRHRPSHGEDCPPDCASHVYYEIQSAERNKGYGSVMFGLAKAEARNIGLKELIVTCDEANEASKRI